MRLKFFVHERLSCNPREMRTRKELKEEYKRTAKPMGIFLIRNTANDKVFVAAGVNLAGTINRHRFQLQKGAHPNNQLQLDWNELGESQFAFEIVDELALLTDDPIKQKADLDALTQLWLQKLQPYDDRGYNERKPTRDQMLHQMAERRTDNRS